VGLASSIPPPPLHACPDDFPLQARLEEDITFRQQQKLEEATQKLSELQARHDELQVDSSPRTFTT